MELENFSIWKNTYKEEGSNQPDYTVNTKVGEKFEKVGGGWISKTEKGDQYISCKVTGVYIKPDAPTTETTTGDEEIF